MSPSQRAPYEAMAKADKLKGKSGGEKYSSQGVPLSQIEREKREKELAERLMKKEIEDTVKDGFANDSKYSNNGFEIGNEKNCFFSCSVQPWPPKSTISWWPITLRKPQIATTSQPK